MTVSLDRFVNLALIKEPLNWAIVAIIATLWLMAFHCIMKGFIAMQGRNVTPAIGANPGQVTTPNAQATIGSAGSLDNTNLGSFLSGGTIGQSSWDTYDAKYAEDGWTGNS